MTEKPNEAPATAPAAPLAAVGDGGPYVVLGVGCAECIGQGAALVERLGYAADLDAARALCVADSPHFAEHLRTAPWVPAIIHDSNGNPTAVRDQWCLAAGSDGGYYAVPIDDHDPAVALARVNITDPAVREAVGVLVGRRAAELLDAAADHLQQQVDQRVKRLGGTDLYAVGWSAAVALLRTLVYVHHDAEADATVEGGAA